jgi:hypothetical protein
MKTVMQEQDSRREGLPLRVQEALGELAGAAQEGLLALSACAATPRRAHAGRSTR